MQLSLIFTFAFQSLEGNDSCRMKIRALYHYNEPSFHHGALYPYENEAGEGGHRKHYNKVSKITTDFQALYKTRGSLNKSSVVKWISDY